MSCPALRPPGGVRRCTSIRPNTRPIAARSTARSVPSASPTIEPVIERHVARAAATTYVAAGGGDFVEAFGSPLPALLFADWFAAVAERRPSLLWRTAQAFVKAWEAFDVETGRAAPASVLYDLARELDRRTREPAPLDPELDPVSTLLAARDQNGETLPREMLVGCVRQILVVGLVAPPVFLGSVAVHLAREPELAGAAAARARAIPAAIEEFLRLYTPYRGFARTTAAARSSAAERSRPASRSRSPMPRPIATRRCSRTRTRFRLDRPNVREHLAFGRGPHRCAGMAMARVELQIALRELLARTAGRSSSTARCG